jgi:peptidoglycan/LPS O-acetylase OafA/YrhL
MFAGLQAGYVGVTLFFVLSGFILTWSYRPSQSATEFYVRRFARVYPSHLVTTAVFWVVGILVQPDMDLVAFFQHLTLMHAWSADRSVGFGLNGVSWSLSVELLFYMLFPFILRFAVTLKLRTAWCAVGGLYLAYATIVQCITSIWPGQHLLQVVYTNPALRLPEFLVGIAVALTLISGFRVPAWSFIPSLALMGAGLLAARQWPALNVWFVPLAAVTIGYLAECDRRGKLGPLRWRWLQYCGRASFAFYLVHWGLIQMVYTMLGVHVMPILYALLLSCAAAATLHHFIEVPVNRWILRRSSRYLAKRAGDNRPALV